jgi:hypothetical protein
MNKTLRGLSDSFETPVVTEARIKHTERISLFNLNLIVSKYLDVMKNKAQFASKRGILRNQAGC